jgi:hypothetical protein
MPKIRLTNIQVQVKIMRKHYIVNAIMSYIKMTKRRGFDIVRSAIISADAMYVVLNFSHLCPFWPFVVFFFLEHSTNRCSQTHIYIHSNERMHIHHISMNISEETEPADVEIDEVTIGTSLLTGIYH